ncbi:MAG: ATP-binding protein, partial [Deltaproteobacteria bacterium]|nr:ATP-binding protein [Deltaproteobacteria bacterium]
GGVAHDFNNLLQIITGYIQLAQRKLGPGHPVQDYLGKMERAGTTAANLTRQLLAFSRKQMLHRSSVNLEDLIGNLLEMLKRVIPENVSFQSQIQKTIWPVLADPSKIEQVVMNLVINACDAMPDGGTLSLKAHNVRADERREVPEDPSLQGPLVILSIEDTGMGMTPEVMERVFEPFFTTKTQGKGTGLGLATVYGIVNQHQGRVMVQSQPGQGSRFTIYLPAHITTLEVRDDEAAEHTSATVQSAGRILLAEDDEAVRELAITVLGQAGYHVTAFPDGEKASLEFQSAPDKYDCAVLDVMMPHIGGVETFDRMVAIRPEFPVLFCSGYGEDQMQAIISRNLPYLQKPFMPDDLLRMVQALLTSRQV